MVSRGNIERNGKKRRSKHSYSTCIEMACSVARSTADLAAEQAIPMQSLTVWLVLFSSTSLFLCAGPHSSGYSGGVNGTALPQYTEKPPIPIDNQQPFATTQIVSQGCIDY